MANIAFDIPLHQSHHLSDEDREAYRESIKSLLRSEDAVLVAHYLSLIHI